MTSTTPNVPVPASAPTFRRVTALRGIRAFGSRPGLRRHKWTATELGELSVAYMEQSCNAPLWKIAQTLHDQFCENKYSECQDESTIATTTTTTTTTGCGYSAIPSIQAIILKLTDCVYLETNGAMDYLYVRRPTQLHAEVWQHLQESRRHRAMIQSMKACVAAKEDDVVAVSSSSPPQNAVATPKAKMQRSSSSSSCPRHICRCASWASISTLRPKAWAPPSGSWRSCRRRRRAAECAPTFRARSALNSRACR